MKRLFRIAYVPAMVLAFASAPLANAATTPSLGSAATYGVLGSTYTNTVAGTTINGDVGFTTGPAVAPAGVHTNYGSGAPYASAVTAQGTALTALASQPCTFTFAPGAVDLSTDITHGPIGIYTPGVYCSNGAMNVGGPITLDGSGTYIFRAVGALTSTAGAVVTSAGASACDVFWTPTQATTLAANTTFIGSVISNAGITIGANTTWVGRALAAGGTVSTDTDTITAPTCDAVVPSPSTRSPIINVVKVPNPLALPAGPGSVTYNYTVNNPGTVTMTDITLTDDKCSNVVYISGDTNANSALETTEDWIYRCTTNLAQTTVNFATAKGEGNGMSSVDTAIAQVIVGVPVIPPLISIVKTPNPASLPFGGGSVVYGYTVTNPGVVALSAVTVVDDKCSNVTRVSGDGNGNNLLEVNETWTYTCTTNVPQTMTNTAIATGHANGLTAIDTALATVVVEGAPLPPLIHIVKQADPVILPAEGGVVGYSFVVTNPGALALSNVSVTDDKCGSVSFVSGDSNSNNLLDVNETWRYTCQQNLTVSTINTATVRGTANGITVTDLSAASVVLSPALIPPTPALPSTGYGSNMSAWIAASAGIFGAFLASTMLFALAQRKRKS